MGKSARRRGLAQRRAAVAYRLLAILAQHRGRRCRPVSAPVHRIAASPRSAAREACRQRDQRGKENAGEPRRPRWPMAAPPPRLRRDGAQAVFGTSEVVGPGTTAPSGSGLPEITVERDTLERGMPAFELFVRAGLAASNSEARRLIKGGGARINDAVVKRRDAAGLARRSRSRKASIKLSAGRKRHALVRPA